ncbi:hypothetical protein A2U01_0060571, partial [Trifolium medium]|nr:hypothetical protein [Trifolium medium]
LCSSKGCAILSLLLSRRSRVAVSSIVVARTTVHLFGKDEVGSCSNPCSPVALEVALP